MKALLKTFFDRAFRHPRTTAVAAVALLGYICTHYGKPLDTDSVAELTGSIATIIAVFANLVMRDAPRVKADQVSGEWQPRGGDK